MFFIIPAAFEILGHWLHVLVNTGYTVLCHRRSSIRPNVHIHAHIRKYQAFFPLMLLRSLLMLRQEMKVALSPSNNTMLAMKLWLGIEVEIKTQWFREQNTLTAWSIHTSALYQQPEEKRILLLVAHTCIRCSCQSPFLLSNEIFFNVCAHCRYENKWPVPKEQIKCLSSLD